MRTIAMHIQGVVDCALFHSYRAMGRKAHPMRDRALQLMRAGLATPREIARVLKIPPNTVENWRQRAALWTGELRDARVRKLLTRGKADDASSQAAE
jgi:hypothetical protein